VERCAPILRDLNLQSRDLYERWYGDLEGGYARKGELMLCLSESTLAGEVRLAERATRLGLQTEVLTRDELAAFEPGIEIDAVGAVYFEDDAQLTPSAFVPALRERLLSAGVRIRDGVEIWGFRMEGSRAIPNVTNGEVSADQIVIAAGAYSGLLAHRLGMNLPLLAGKGYGFTVADPPARPEYPAILVDGRVAVTPMLDGLRFVGTMELGAPALPEINETRLRGMRRSIERAYPAFRGFDFGSAPVWTGLRPCSPDGMPYLGRSRRHSNVLVATGHGMMGMSLGPVTGEIVAQLIDGEPPAVPLDLMQPDRYGALRI
jgi:D-amino-acid dehydrogenase